MPTDTPAAGKPREYRFEHVIEAAIITSLQQYGLSIETARMIIFRRLTGHTIEEKQRQGRPNSFWESEALQYRDLLESRITFAAAVLADCHDLFTELLARPGEFMARSKVFEMFRYDLAMEETAANYQATVRWMQFTTGLTKYEAQACIRHFDFSRHRRMLDIGGNSGEFALRVCKAHAAIETLVFDLPVVCEVGRDHVSTEPEASRISFHKGDARTAPLPEGCDLVSFKSFLHDWPEDETDVMLKRATDALAPGGSLLIFERGVVEAPETALPYSMIPGLLFLHFYRDADFYTGRLAALGYNDIQVQEIDLEMPFQLITAKKPS
jgi:ubiquinone/menaquinone biosynthesis C-methylase UbiE